MNAARRARQKDRRAAGGGHTGRQHVQGHPCPVCRPGRQERAEVPGWRAPAMSMDQALAGQRSLSRAVGSRKGLNLILGVADEMQFLSRKARLPSSGRRIHRRRSG